MDKLNQAPKKVSFYTLGCRLNFSESSEISQSFAEKGYQIVPFGQEADVTFVNTCTVTDSADASCRNIFRKAKKASPQTKLVVSGCYAQMDAKKISSMPEVDLVLGTQDKYKVLELLDSEQKIHISKSREFFKASSQDALSRTRAFLKVQDGCNYICSFCIIPQARGRSRTISVQEGINQAKNLISLGYKEIVITGVNVGEYNKTSGEKLEDMIKAIASIDGIKRLRLSSVEPNTITKSLLETLKSTEIYQNHFHIPLQSGSDRMLNLMRRRYDRAQYLATLEMVHDFFPEASIGADMIVGHHGETEDDFEATYDLAKNYGLTHFHVFPFSQRKDTLSARMSDEAIDPEIKKSRVKRLIALGDQKIESLARSFVGQRGEVLFENEKSGLWQGLSSHYLRVQVPTDENLHNKIQKVRFTSHKGATLVGEIVKD